MNPELRRNLWLEMTTHRLLGMPAILALIFLVASTVSEPAAGIAVCTTALGSFIALTMLWGTRQAANSVVDEFSEKTWDWQRLSALNPWTMTWGKLFGSTAFAWYGGILCLLVFIPAAYGQQYRSPIKLCIGLILATITLHGFAITSALHIAKKGTISKRRSFATLMVLALILINIGLMTVARIWGTSTIVYWYGNGFDLLNFSLLSACAFAAWSLTSAYRSMCNHLMVRTTPWLWLLFLIFITIYTTGFVSDQMSSIVPTQAAFAGTGLVWGLLFTYLLMFTELSGPDTFRRIAWKMQAQEWRRVFEELPCWPLSWIFAALCALVLCAYGLDANKQMYQLQITTIPLATALLAARDAGILLFFLAAPQPKRAAGTALIYIAVLSWIFPALLHGMKLQQLAQLLLPVGSDKPVLGVISALIQASIALGLAWRRIRQRYNS